MSESLQLIHYPHPDPKLGKRFEQIVGLDGHKEQLLGTLYLILNKKGLQDWLKKHHSGNLPFLANGEVALSPLIILSGDVGCGKTELALSVCTPLSKKMGKGGITINCYETPSNIRGTGLVGELSARITEAFKSVTSKANKDAPVVLIIDEGDDLATSREQNQAHHEDRAGVNVLIKEIERLASNKLNVAVILITNRYSSLDPAVVRRASLHLAFERPKPEQLRPLFESMLDGVKHSSYDMDALIAVCQDKSPLFNFSDIRRKAGAQALIRAFQQDRPFDAKLLCEVLQETQPSPTFQN